MSLGAPLGYTHFSLFLGLCLRCSQRPLSLQVTEPEQILPFPQRECAFFSRGMADLQPDLLAVPFMRQIYGFGIYNLVAVVKGMAHGFFLPCGRDVSLWNVCNPALTC